MLFRGLLRLTWLELKIFLREPLGAVGTILIPVVAFVVLGRALGRRTASGQPPGVSVSVDVPVFAALLIVLSAVMSLVTIISIYREGGILKRLRATPLRPYTILSAHVVVKLLLTVVTLSLIVLAGKRYYPTNLDVPVVGFDAGAAAEHAQHHLDGLPHCERGSDRAVRPADRRGHPLSDGGRVGTLHAARFAAAGAARRRASGADHLCRVAPQGHPRQRSVGGSRRRRRGLIVTFVDLHGAVGESLPLGIAAGANLAPD